MTARQWARLGNVAFAELVFLGSTIIRVAIDVLKIFDMIVLKLGDSM